MIGSTWKKLACVGLIACAAVFSGCGNSSKVVVVDYQKIENESPKVKDIQKQITDKDTEIQNRLNQEAQSGLSDEEMQKKVQAAQQERMILFRASRRNWNHSFRRSVVQLLKKRTSELSCIKERCLLVR